ncbi:MAG: lauroyl acyltransferase [Rhodospirillaceae bacterium]|jgi:Kdo2-lipid IVA lauroyltransferase/acyltransferase|nr:lauroyl acyltransferase [Rhodospirillaceae bacterium]
MLADRPPLKRFLLDPLLAVVTVIVYALFRSMRFWAASALGGLIARTIGPHLPINRRAVRNVRLAFPEKTDAEVKAIIREMWDNLGRMAGEYPHLGKMDVYKPFGFVDVEGAENVDLLRDDDKPGIFFSAHIANWEIVSLGAIQRGLPLDRVYRAANNRLTEWLYHRGRATGGDGGQLIPKGAKGARMLVKSLKDGRHLGMLVDQKMNDGIPVPFFGRDAMTAPALAELALRYDCPVVPARVVRIKGPKLRLIVEPPLEFTPTGDRHADVAALMALVNQRLESWIRDTPGQWLWLHNRWPD